MPKMYPTLKTFIVVAYMHRILAQQFCNTAKQQRYTPQNHNMYNVFKEKDYTNTTDTTITNVAAFMTGSTLMGGQTATIPELAWSISSEQTKLH